jgi:hypothetical protein
VTGRLAAVRQHISPFHITIHDRNLSGRSSPFAGDAPEEQRSHKYVDIGRFGMVSMNLCLFGRFALQPLSARPKIDINKRV